MPRQRSMKTMSFIETTTHWDFCRTLNMWVKGEPSWAMKVPVQCTSPLTALSTIPLPKKTKNVALVPPFYTLVILLLLLLLLLLLFIILLFLWGTLLPKLIHTTLKSLSNSTFFTYKPIKKSMKKDVFLYCFSSRT